MFMQVKMKDERTNNNNNKTHPNTRNKSIAFLKHENDSVNVPSIRRRLLTFTNRKNNELIHNQWLLSSSSSMYQSCF